MIVPTLLECARMPVTVQLIGAWSWASVTTLSPAWMWPLTLSTVSGCGRRPPPARPTGSPPSSPSRARRRRRRPGCPAGRGRSWSSCRGRSRGRSPSRAPDRCARRGRPPRPGWWRRPGRRGPSRWSVTYCRSWSSVSFTVSPSTAGVDSSMPDGIGLPPLPDLHPPVAGGAGELVLELALDAGQAGAVTADEADHLAADRAGRVQPDGVVLEGDARQLERVDGVGLLRRRSGSARTT